MKRDRKGYKVSANRHQPTPQPITFQQVICTLVKRKLHRKMSLYYNLNYEDLFQFHFKLFKLKKSNFRYTRLITFRLRVSRVSGAHLRGFAPGPTHRQGRHIKVVVSRWQRVGDLIGSGFESYISRTRRRRLTTWPI